MSKKLLSIILIIALIFSFAFVGCSKKPAEDVNNENTESAETQPESPPEENSTPAEPEGPKNPALDRGNILTFGETSLDGVFNSILSDNVYDTYICTLLFRGLALNDTAGEPTPDVAEKWEISEDGKTYTFFLRKGVKFHDGHELTAEDVEFTYYTIAHPDYAGPRWSVMKDVIGAEEYRKGEADTIEGIKIIDDYTISFTVKEVNAAKFGAGDFTYGILPKHIYEFSDYSQFLSLNQNPTGNGPFKFVRYVVGQYVEMEAFDDYHFGRPKLDGVLFKIVPDETRAAEIQAGVIDVTQLTANLEEVEIATETDIANIQQYVGNGYTYIGFNLRLDKFKDKRVRKALMYGLNREAFIQSHYQGFARPCNTAVSPVSWAYTDKITEYTYDPVKASELLKEAGWIDRDDDGWVENESGEELEITWTAYNDVEWPQILIAIAKENWKEIGVKLEGELMEFNAVAEKVYDNRDFDIYNMGWSLSIDPDPTGIFDKASDTPGGYNSTGFYNEEAEEIMAKGQKEMDSAKRKELYQRWAEIANDELPYLFIAYRDELFAVNKRVKNLKITPYEDWTYYIHEVEVDY